MVGYTSNEHNRSYSRTDFKPLRSLQTVFNPGDTHPYSSTEGEDHASLLLPLSTGIFCLSALSFLFLKAGILTRMWFWFIFPRWLLVGSMFSNTCGQLCACLLASSENILPELCLNQENKIKKKHKYVDYAFSNNPRIPGSNNVRITIKH